MRNLENHDFGRFSPMVKNDMNKIYNWTSQVFFSKGATMIYAGQEYCDTNLPSLFDIDNVNWDGENISSLVKKLSEIKKNKIFSYGSYKIIASQPLKGYVSSFFQLFDEVFQISVGYSPRLRRRECR